VFVAIDLAHRVEVEIIERTDDHRRGIHQAEDHAAFLFVGNVDPVPPFFGAIDISINTAEMEILSMSLCEAQACGKATVAYNVGGNAEAVGDSASVVPFGDLDALEARVAQLVMDESERTRAGREAERHVRARFDSPVLAARQAAIYEEILGRSLDAA
jgi:glycosyltransferase involved in cell wall biosynthesis